MKQVVLVSLCVSTTCAVSSEGGEAHRKCQVLISTQCAEALDIRCLTLMVNCCLGCYVIDS